MLVGFAEGLGAAKTYASRNHYEIDPSRELIGLGAANLASGLSSGMVVNGSLSKTAVNASAGARTQLSGVVVAAMTVVTLLFLTGLFESLPEATLAGVVIAAPIELVDFPALAAYYRVYSKQLGRACGVASRPDFIAAVAAMLGVLVFDSLPGLFIGIAISLLPASGGR
jgi:SulP family sulfate permease